MFFQPSFSASHQFYEPQRVFKAVFLCWRQPTFISFACNQANDWHYHTGTHTKLPCDRPHHCADILTKITLWLFKAWLTSGSLLHLLGLLQAPALEHGMLTLSLLLWDINLSQPHAILQPGTFFLKGLGTCFWNTKSRQTRCQSFWLLRQARA